MKAFELNKRRSETGSDVCDARNGRGTRSRFRVPRRSECEYVISVFIEMLASESIVRIQSTWRSVKCRNKIRVFRSLPDDLWSHILHFVRSVDPIWHVADRIIQSRAKKLYFTPPLCSMRAKLHTLKMSQKYATCLSEDTYYRCVALALRLQRYNKEKITQLLLNAALETLTVLVPIARNSHAHFLCR